MMSSSRFLAQWQRERPALKSTFAMLVMPHDNHPLIRCACRHASCRGFAHPPSMCPPTVVIPVVVVSVIMVERRASLSADALESSLSDLDSHELLTSILNFEPASPQSVGDWIPAPARVDAENLRAYPERRGASSHIQPQTLTRVLLYKIKYRLVRFVGCLGWTRDPWCC